jgi:DNA-binding transcriptional regulator YiaG
METVNVQALRKVKLKMDRSSFAKLIGISPAQCASAEVGRRKLSMSAMKIVWMLDSGIVTKEQLEAL